MTLTRIALLAAILSALPMISGTAQSRPFNELNPLPPGATWDTLYHVYHEHQFADDGATAEAFSDFVVHRLATRWSTVARLVQLITTDSTFGVFVIKHVDATTDEAELRSILTRSRASCPRRARTLCVAIHAAASHAVSQTAQPN